VPQRVVGLDVGSYSVKAAVIHRSFKSFELVSFYERPIHYSDVLTPEQSIVSAIQALIDDNNLVWDDIISAVPGEKVATRLITMPFGSIKKIDKTVAFEIEDYIPLDLDSVVFDYNASVLGKNLAKVMVAYASKTELAKYISLLNDAGVDPRIISAGGVDLVNLIHFGFATPDAPCAIIDIGHTKTTITICRGKKLILSRTIPIAGRLITERISSKLSIPYDEAARLKIEVGRISIEEQPESDEITTGVNSAIKEVVDSLIVHIKQTFFAYRETENEAVSGIYMSGGTSRLAGIDQYLSYVLRQNVTSIDPTMLHFYKIEHSESHPAVMNEAIAIALRGVSFGGSSGINFRSGEFAYRVGKKKIGGASRRIATIIGILAMLGFVYFGAEYCSLSNKNKEMNQEIARLVSNATGLSPEGIQSANDAIKLAEKKEREVKEKIDKLEMELGIGVLDILRNISINLPPKDKAKIDVYEFRYSGDTVVIKGVADSPTSVDEIQRQLQGTNENKTMFTNIKTGGLSKVKDGYKFDITMQVSKEGSSEQEKGKEK